MSPVCVTSLCHQSISPVRVTSTPVRVTSLSLSQESFCRFYNVLLECPENQRHLNCVVFKLNDRSNLSCFLPCHLHSAVHTLLCTARHATTVCPGSCRGVCLTKYSDCPPVPGAAAVACPPRAPQSAAVPRTTFQLQFLVRHTKPKQHSNVKLEKLQFTMTINTDSRVEIAVLSPSNSGPWLLLRSASQYKSG